MYLPDAAVLGPDAGSLRKAITDAFRSYKIACEELVWPKYLAVEHWAKIEMPGDETELSNLRKRMHDKYPLEEFNLVRRLLDPKCILSNRLIEAILSQATLPPPAG